MQAYHTMGSKKFWSSNILFDQLEFSSFQKKYTYTKDTVVIKIFNSFLQKLFYHIVPSLGKFNDSCSQNSLSHIS